LVPPGRPAELAEALTEAARMPPAGLLEMGAASRKSAESYRVKHVTERLLDAYQELGFPN
jgi:hypothetical protein